MTPKTLTSLAVASVISVAAAAYAVSNEPGFINVERGGRVFPGLNERINEVARIEVRTNGRTLSMSQGDGGWILEESGGYALKPEIVKGAILGFAGLTYVEPKTAKPDLYAKLELRDPEKQGSLGRAVKIISEDGDVLVDAVLGKVRYNMPGTTRDGIYLRLSGTPRTWLALGQLDVSGEPADWLQQELIDIAAARILSAEVRHPDGETLRIGKKTPEDPNFSLLDMPAGKHLKYDADPTNIATVLEALELEDVRKSGDAGINEDTAIRTSIRTVDGLRVDILMKNADDHWVTLKATAENSDEKRVKEADAINRGVGPWAFKLPGYKATRLNKRLADMLKNREQGS